MILLKHKKPDNKGGNSVGRPKTSLERWGEVGGGEGGGDSGATGIRTAEDRESWTAQKEGCFLQREDDT